MEGGLLTFLGIPEYQKYRNFHLVLYIRERIEIWVFWVFWYPKIPKKQQKMAKMDKKWLLLENGKVILDSFTHKITAIKSLKDYRGYGYGKLSVVLREDYEGSHSQRCKEVQKNIMGFQEVDPNYWKPEKENDNITGTLLKVQEDVGSNNSKLYTFEVEGKPINVWGSVILDQKMVGVQVGDLTRITFKGLGEAKGGHNAPKIFKVEVDKS